jgi:glycosyltransferase involved in cell wall biosynthesis
MRIGISLLNFRQGAVGGIETYIRKLIEHAPSLAGTDEVIFFTHLDNQNVVPDSACKIVVKHPQRVIDLFRILESCTPWRARSIERLITHANVDVMLYTQQSMFPLHSTIPSALLVADVQYLFSPQYYSWLDLRFRKSIYLASLQQCTKIIAISGVTANHLTEHCHVSADKIEIIHLGYDPKESPVESSVTTPDFPYLYYPAVTYPHKGHAQLIRTFAQLKRSGKMEQKLIFSGIQSSYWRILKKMIQSEGLADDIIHLGYVPYTQVQALYKGADAVLFPTEFEGFGIPVLEAVQFQKRIICSELPIFDELGVPHKWQIDYSDPLQLLKALQQEGPTTLTKEPIRWRESIARNMNLLRMMGKEKE